MTDQELKDLVASLAVSQAQTDEQIQKLRKAQAQTDEQIQKLRKAQAQTDEQMRKTDEQMRKTDEQLKKTDEKINRIASLVGSISNNQGNVAEEYFINSLEEYLKVGTINFDYMIPNFKAKKAHKILAEYDILLVNGESVAIVEVKYKAHLNDLDQLPIKIKQLKNLPQYKNYKVYAGIATFYATDELIQKAQEKGYFILQRKGDVIVTHSHHLKTA
jgi:hypothetical protein